MSVSRLHAKMLLARDMMYQSSTRFITPEEFFWSRRYPRFYDKGKVGKRMKGKVGKR